MSIPGYVSILPIYYLVNQTRFLIYYSVIVHNIELRRRFLYDGPTFVPQIWEYGNFSVRKLYSLCSPGNQYYQKIIYFLLFFIKKGRNQEYISLIISRFLNNNNQFQ